MLLKPFGILKNDNPDPYQQSHVGRVVDNNDPDRLKRVRVNLPIWEHMTDEQLPWVKQQGDGTIGGNPDETNHHIPEIGAQVRVTFMGGNPDDPQYSGMESTTENKCSVFDEDYPNTYGKKDSLGNIEITNKRTGITLKKHHSGLTMQIDPDGKCLITAAENPSATILFDEMGVLTYKGPKIVAYADDEISLNSTAITLNAENLVTIHGQGIAMQADAGITMGAPDISINASSNITMTGMTNIAKLRVMGGHTVMIPDLVTHRMVFITDGVCTGELGAG